MFIRSPVRWINSAWWQWGVWDENNKNFNNWLEKAINKCKWENYLFPLLNSKIVDEFSIFPLKKDIIEHLWKVIIFFCEF